MWIRKKYAEETVNAEKWRMRRKGSYQWRQTGMGFCCMQLKENDLKHVGGNDTVPV